MWQKFSPPIWGSEEERRDLNRRQREWKKQNKKGICSLDELIKQMEVVLQRLYRLLVRQRDIASGMPKREIDRKIASGGYNMPYETVKKKLDENLDFSGVS